MDEADLLGDRVAIMAEGQIRCVGTSHFLKERYGVGYHFTIVKNEHCKPQLVTQYVKKHIPSAKLHSDVGHELSYILPGDQTSKFGSFFKQFEEESGALGVESFGMSLTTMEEVFLRVEERAEETEAERHQRKESILVARQSSLSMSVRNTPSVSSSHGSKERNSGLNLWFQQFVAMYMKRFLNSKRDVYALIWQLLLPIIFTALALLNVRLIEFGGDDPARVMTLRDLGPTTSYIADYSQTVDAEALKSSEDYLKTVGVKQTLNVYNASLMTQKEADKVTDCCQNKFFVLQQTCISKITGKSKPDLDTFISSCGDSLGYRLCDAQYSENNCESNGNCLICSLGDSQSMNNQDSQRLLHNPDPDCPLLPSTLAKKFEQTYFMQYILETSNDETFFDDHASGFTLLPRQNNQSFIKYYQDREIELGNASIVGTVWYSNQAFHTSAAALNAYSNIVLQFALREHIDPDDVKKHTITVTNHPLPKTTESRSEDAQTDPSGLVLSFFVSLGLGFLACSFIMFPIQERESNAKHLQFLSGVTPSCYWFGTFFWDLTNYLIPALIILILFAAFQIEVYTDDIGAIFLVLILYGFAVLPFVYLISFLFNSPYVGFAAAVLLIVMTSWFGFILVYVFALPSIDLKSTADTIAYIFSLQPNFVISQALADMYTNGQLKKACTVDIKSEIQCSRNDVKYFDNVLHFERPGIGIGCLYMAVEAVVFFLLVLLAEYRFFTGKIMAYLRSNQVVYQPRMDEVSGLLLLLLLLQGLYHN
jgi:ATP-binding cassette subfamily A (ABC1) protein 3